MLTTNLPLFPSDVIKINIIGCTNLVAKDRNGFSDGYAIIESVMAGSIDLIDQSTNQQQQLKTSVKKKSLNPIWNESFSIPALSHSGIEFVKIKIRVMDYDVLSKDDFLGDVEFTIDNSIGSNIEKIFASKLNNIDHGLITVGITIERSPENVEIDKYRQELLNTPSTGYTIHKGGRYLHFQSPNFFIIDSEEYQESQRILLRYGNKTLQFYILENANDYPFGMSKEKVLNLAMYVEQHRSIFKYDQQEIRIRSLGYFAKNSQLDHLEQSTFVNQVNSQLRYGQAFAFDQVDLPYCCASMILTSDEDDYKINVLTDFILNSLFFEEK